MCVRVTTTTATTLLMLLLSLFFFFLFFLLLFLLTSSCHIFWFRLGRFFDCFRSPQSCLTHQNPCMCRCVCVCLCIGVQQEQQQQHKFERKSWVAIPVASTSLPQSMHARGKDFGWKISHPDRRPWVASPNPETEMHVCVCVRARACVCVLSHVGVGDKLPPRVV